MILSTYDAPESLSLALTGYSVQTHGACDVVVADDGSGPDTTELLDEMADLPGLRMSHVRQNNRGFRKARILNRAIMKARGDYLVFSDGDCIPRADFVETHARLSRKGYFVSGGRVCLRPEFQLDPAHIVSGVAFDSTWLRGQRALSRGRDRRKLVPPGRRMARLHDLWTTTAPTWNGHNVSGWKVDLLRVNGFDERMTYPAEDRELGSRLANAAVRGIQARHRAVCLHIDHDRPWTDPTEKERNLRLWAETRGGPRWLGRILDRWHGRGSSWTEHGIA